MNEKFKKLKEENENRKINEIVGEIHGEAEKSRKAIMRKIELLYYLQTTSRFRELREYKSADFETFVENEFNISSGLYEWQRRAVLGVPEECEKHGVRYVAKVLRDTETPEKVFNDLNRLKTKPSWEKRQEVFQRYRKPKPEKQPDIRPTVAQMDALKQEVRELKKERDELKEQVRKLKAALRKRDHAITELDGLIKPFVPALEARA